MPFVGASSGVDAIKRSVRGTPRHGVARPVAGETDDARTPLKQLDVLPRVKLGPNIRSYRTKSLTNIIIINH
ncbi:hypothetical protein GCM10007209_33630 [Haloferax sulfurifontis]|uniref:Uncharacterized protein n=1 Tax=Haloferax sulfurifontis TaxID=255616 RepID=A0A830E1R9_9EURY|nr:hypothetical protein GCM10007209_33630 [Haloferax sulfurifontis]